MSVISLVPKEKQATHDGIDGVKAFVRMVEEGEVEMPVRVMLLVEFDTRIAVHESGKPNNLLQRLGLMELSKALVLELYQ